jgi:hypothetical protein
MVAGRHNLTRRALLGAAAGVPLAGFAPADAPRPDPTSPFALSSACPELAEGSKPVLSDAAGGVEGGCPSCCAEEVKAGLRQPRIGSGAERSCSTAGDRTPWTRALAAYRRAEAKLAAFRAYEASLPAPARRFPACAPLEERGNDLECARLARLRRLLRAPAPDLPALALKIALAVDDEIAFYTGGEACLAAVKADALRLCGGQAVVNMSA